MKWTWKKAGPRAAERLGSGFIVRPGAKDTALIRLAIQFGFMIPASRKQGNSARIHKMTVDTGFRVAQSAEGRSCGGETSD